MSPALEPAVCAMSAEKHVRVLRGLLRQAEHCLILLHPEEVEAIEDAIALYGDDGAPVIAPDAGKEIA